MFTVIVTEKGGSQRRMDFDKNEVTIGRVQGNDVILPKGNVSKRHSRIASRDARFIVVDLKSTNGTYVNGRKITSPLVVKPGDKIYIGDFILTLEDHSQGTPAVAIAPGSEPAPPPAPGADLRARARPAPPPLRAPGEVSGDLTAPPAVPGTGQFKPSRADPSLDHTPPPAEGERFALEDEPSADASAPMSAPVAPPPAAAVPAATRGTTQGSPAVPAPIAPVHSVGAPAFEPPRGSAAARLQPSTQIPAAPVPPAPEQRSSYLGAEPANSPESALRVVMGQIALSFDVHNADPRLLQDAARWEQAKRLIDTLITEMDKRGQLSRTVDREPLAQQALHEAVGLGPLDALLLDESVREVIIEGSSRISVDAGAGLQPNEAGFSSPAMVSTVARRLAAQAGETLDPARPFFSAMLANGAHIAVVQAPVAARGTIIQVRRTGIAVTIEELVGRGMLVPDVVAILRAAVRARRNVFVGGPVGCGVSTLVGAIASLLGDEERIVTVSEAPDLAVEKPYVVSLCAGSSEAGATFRDVLHHACRMRANRLVIDDVGGSEVFDVLTVVATRMPGAIVGVNTSHDRSALAQIESLARLQARGNDLAITQLVASAVHLVVQVGRDSAGNIRVTGVVEVTGARGNALQTTDLFVFDSTSLKGTGKTATFV